ncbi:TetR/AcrR family transcriptional regulator, partial [Streptomyces sp. SID2955]|nr:TetR/AcrR family transcriptional regulator [Streptomyces sp. SID2955]
EAVRDALDELGQSFDTHLRGVDDPAELVAAGFRLSARLADSRPELMQVLRHRGLGHVHSDSGLARRAVRDLELGVASGRFAVTDPVVALTALGGSLLALVELRFARPDVDGDEAASRMAEMLLSMLGVPAEEAREVARRPLPDLG